jgi:hypothetical protein
MYGGPAGGGIRRGGFHERDRAGMDSCLPIRGLLALCKVCAPQTAIWVYSMLRSRLAVLGSEKSFSKSSTTSEAHALTSHIVRGVGGFVFGPSPTVVGPAGMFGKVFGAAHELEQYR